MFVKPNMVVRASATRPGADVVNFALHVSHTWEREGRKYITGVLTEGERAGQLATFRADRICPFRFENGKAVAVVVEDKPFEAEMNLVVMPQFLASIGFVEDVNEKAGKALLCRMRGGAPISALEVEGVEIAFASAEEIAALNATF